MSKYENIEKEIIESTQTGLWILEYEENKTPRLFTNSAMDRLIGIDGDASPEEHYEYFVQRIHPEDRELFARYSEKITQGKQTEIVYRYLNDKLGELYIRCEGIRDYSANGYLCLKGIHRDVTEHIRFEREREEAERLSEVNRLLQEKIAFTEGIYQQIIQMQSCGILVYKPKNHELILVNDSAKRYCGLELDAEISAEDLERVNSLVQFDDPSVIPQMRSISKPGDSAQCFVRIPHDDGTYLHIWVNKQAVMTNDNEIIFLTSLQDITELSKLQFMNETLKNALANAEEADKRSKLAMDEANRANQAKTSFLFNMSHDIRTPMNAIVGYTDLMNKYRCDEDRFKLYYKRTKDSEKFLLNLINNVLETARIERGYISLDETKSFTLIDEAVITCMEPEINAKNLTLNFHPEIVHPYIMQDETKMEQILLNLLSNAVKYTKPGGEIDYIVSEESIDKDTIRIKTVIRDNGIGMSREFLPHVFEQFARAATSTDNKIPGTGLGLGIVKKLIDIMGGTINIESELGKGTTVTVIIPHKICDDTEEEAAQKTLISFSLKNKRILLAEDNDLNTDIAIDILSDLGAKTEHASDGVECINMVKEHEAGYYDLILMDVQMPNMDGLKATRIIRDIKNKKIAQIPIVAMTANAFEEDKRKCIDAGMDGFVSKPFEVARLVEVLAAIRERE